MLSVLTTVAVEAGTALVTTETGTVVVIGVEVVTAAVTVGCTIVLVAVVVLTTKTAMYGLV